MDIFCKCHLHKASKEVFLAKEFLKSCVSFLRKSQFSTLTDLNPVFGIPWDILEYILQNSAV